jgi:hypothetical protein
VASGRLAATWHQTGPAGRRVIAEVSGTAAGSERSSWPDSTTALASTASVSANWPPMQARGPPPKGNQA